MTTAAPPASRRTGRGGALRAVHRHRGDGVADGVGGRRREGATRPTPAATTAAALAGWSRPSGMHTSGTPWRSAARIVPRPAWHTTTAAPGTTAACGHAPGDGGVGGARDRRRVEVVADRRHDLERLCRERAEDALEHGALVHVGRAERDHDARRTRVAARGSTVDALEHRDRRSARWRRADRARRRAGAGTSRGPRGRGRAARRTARCGARPSSARSAFVPSTVAAIHIGPPSSCTRIAPYSVCTRAAVGTPAASVAQSAPGIM